ncbi:MAG TPA: hypothetical protein VIW03_04625 [Anaeromyxobacter sp.]
MTRLGRPAMAEGDQDTREVFVADGYFNRRVIVFDAVSGAHISTSRTGGTTRC